MKIQHLVLTLVALLLVAACSSSSPPTASAGDIQTAIALTQAAQGTLEASNPTRTPEETLPPTTPTNTIPVYTGPISGRVSAFSLNLRNGPSTLHKVIGTYEGGTELAITARVAEGDWVEVEIGDHVGWMFAELLDIYGDVNSLPIITFPDSLAVRGRVEDTSGNPIQGIIISTFYQSVQGELRVNVTSDQNGEFSIYLPQDLLGTLDVQISGRGCQSRVVNVGCQLEGYVQLEDRTFVTIPQQGEIVFLYEPVTMKLKGKVLNSDGSIVAGIDVAGIRDDGAKTFGATDANGQFSMPIDEGIWDIFSYSFDPAGEGTRKTITVTNTPPADIEILSPYGGVDVIATPIGSVPSNVVLAQFLSQSVLRSVNNYNSGGRPVMKIYEPRYIYSAGEQIWIYSESILTDGGNYYYELYDPNFSYPVTMYVRVVDVEIIPK